MALAFRTVSGTPHQRCADRPGQRLRPLRRSVRGPTRAPRWFPPSTCGSRRRSVRGTTLSFFLDARNVLGTENVSGSSRPPVRPRTRSAAEFWRGDSAGRSRGGRRRRVEPEKGIDLTFGGAPILAASAGRWRARDRRPNCASSSGPSSDSVIEMASSPSRSSGAPRTVQRVYGRPQFSDPATACGWGSRCALRSSAGARRPRDRVVVVSRAATPTPPPPAPPHPAGGGPGPLPGPVEIGGGGSRAHSSAASGRPRASVGASPAGSRRTPAAADARVVAPPAKSPRSGPPADAPAKTSPAVVAIAPAMETFRRCAAQYPATALAAPSASASIRGSRSVRSHAAGPRPSARPQDQSRRRTRSRRDGHHPHQERRSGPRGRSRGTRPRARGRTQNPSFPRTTRSPPQVHGQDSAHEQDRRDRFSGPGRDRPLEGRERELAEQHRIDVEVHPPHSG